MYRPAQARHLPIGSIEDREGAGQRKQRMQQAWQVRPAVWRIWKVWKDWE